MGNSSSRKAPPVITTCKSPVYCVRRIGNRHLLLAGGGGAAATGVTNQIETLLLTADLHCQTGSIPLKATLSSQIRTDPYATMNMDVVGLGSADQGRYLIACGQDEFCVIYESNGFIVDPEDTEKNLSFDIRPVGKLRTDEKADGPYQKCCAFDRSTHGSRIVTGGADGHVRVWSVRDLVEHRDPTLTRKSLLDINAHKSDVDAVDVSPDGRYVVSVGDGTALIWCLQLGKQIAQIPPPPTLSQGFKVRSVQFTTLGDKNLVLLAAFNQTSRTSSSVAYLVLYVFNRESGNIRPIVVKDVLRGDAISTVSLSQDGSLVGVGTMGGTVLVLETHELKTLLVVPQTHGIFVTGVEFLDHSARDLQLPRELSLEGSIPGPAAPYRASLVSLSADQTVQVHNIPFHSSSSFSLSLFCISLLSFISYLFFWFLTCYI